MTLEKTPPVAPAQVIVSTPVPFRPYYQDEAVTIYNADCRQVLPFLPKFDLVLTDPPYGVTQQAWDTIESVKNVIASAPLAVFTTGERLLAALIEALPKQYRHIWVWDRVNRNTDYLNAARRPMRAHELIAVFSKEARYRFEPIKRPGYHRVRQPQTASNANGSYGDKKPEQGYGTVKTELHPRSIIDFRGNKTNTQFHPTEKPVALYEYLLQSYPAEITVDPYMGSGTTLVAARNCGRRCVGIEISEEYCEIAAKRLSQGTLF